MRLLRYGPAGQERPALLDSEGGLRDLGHLIPDLAREHLANLRAIAAADWRSLPLVEGAPRIGACVGQPGNFIAVGVNYREQAAESNLPVPGEPILFNKAPNCVSGPFDDIVIPQGGTRLDYEVELAVVIGTPCSYVNEQDALAHVAGFCVGNDISERAFQLERGGNWMKGKSAPTFGPLGPWLVTPDGFADVQALDIWLDVDGERMQSGNTRSMVFGVAAIVSYVSRFMMLDPGDVILTGTPAGVGAARTPPRYLKAGERVTCGISGLGEQSSMIVPWRAQS
jgi:2,4-didehydro-3-deoxy-L-rhamnonate hydrolase